MGASSMMPLRLRGGRKPANKTLYQGPLHHFGEQLFAKYGTREAADLLQCMPCRQRVSPPLIPAACRVLETHRESLRACGLETVSPKSRLHYASTIITKNDKLDEIIAGQAGYARITARRRCRNCPKPLCGMRRCQKRRYLKA